MKKILLLAVAALLCSTGYVSAQKGVNKDSYLNKLEKSNADIENPKKNTKASTWVSRGDLFLEMGAAPTKELFKGRTEEELKYAYGNPAEITTGAIDRDQYALYIYPDFKAYLKADGTVACWEQTTTILDGAFDKAYENYAKAYDMDAKSASGVKKGIEALANEYKKYGDNIFSFRNFEGAADNFAKAYEVQLHPAVNVVDREIAYSAGLFYTMSMKFDKGEPYLEKAIEEGFDADGDAYYYLYYCYYGQGRPDEAMTILKTGLAKHPANSSIIEGLVTLYNNTEGADPQEIVPLVEDAIKDDPDNHLLWSGLGGVYEKLGNYDKAIEAYKKSVELAPEDFVNNYKLGYAYFEYGNAIIEEVNKNGMTTNAEAYKLGIEKANAEFHNAVAPLEKAHQLNPNSVPPVALLKNIMFRFREEPGMMEKYNKYDELYKKLNQ